MVENQVFGRAGGNFVRGGYPPRKTAKCRWEMSKETLKERLDVDQHIIICHFQKNK